jgi:hypothetical protein
MLAIETSDRRKQAYFLTASEMRQAATCGNVRVATDRTND